MTKPIDKYLKEEDDEFQEWTRNTPWIQRAITKEDRVEMQIRNDMHLGQFNSLVTRELSTTNAKLIQQNIISTLQIIKSLIIQYKTFKDEALNIRIILKTNIDTLTMNVYQKYSELISEINHKNILKRKHHQLHEL